MCNRGWQPLSVDLVRQAADRGEVWALKALEQLRRLERLANQPQTLRIYRLWS